MRIACDPECFLYDRESNTIVSAIGKFATKKIGRVSIEVDNVLAEFQIEPTDDRTTFIIRVKRGIQAIRDESGMDVCIKSSHEFTKQYLKSLPPKAYVFGCNRDMNAYTEGLNPKPNPYTNTRTAGGHLHIDMPDKGLEGRAMLVKLCDLYLGVPSVLLDSDRARRRMYGKAGAFRRKQYGIEYRTLSNFWLRDEKLMGWVYDQVRVALDMSEYVNKLPYAKIRECIDTSNVVLANRLITQHRIQMP